MNQYRTPEQQKIADWLATHQTNGFAKGLGTRETACTIAAVNLALSNGESLTDNTPNCASPVVCAWAIRVQDAMPAEIRNGTEWRALVPLIAGTRDGRDAERVTLLLGWMWGTVLPTLQPIADAGGYGDAWRIMLRDRTEESAYAAANAAAAYARAAADATYDAAADDYDAAAAAAAYAADADADAYARAADAADAAAAAYAAAWDTFDPASVLRRLVSLPEMSE